jgi:hypothetical protein
MKKRKQGVPRGDPILTYKITIVYQYRNISSNNKQFASVYVFYVPTAF